MSKAAKFFKYENPLAKTVVTKGGLSAEDAIAAAEARVEEVRQPTLEDLDRGLAEIAALRERLGDGDAAALQSMYQEANRIVAVGGVFGLGQLGEAAYSLCELISRFQAGGRFSRAMVDVHLDGLKLLRTPDEHDETHRDQVLSGLRQVTASVG
ncbi:chemotaxis protein CheE [Phenylobacterium sp. J367]|uniref:chemotaxis protein CheE n=1 Tax=Phenylobacterium sp. J367 TaxID=2898435 RepID=UPI00215103B0|nr:chemotaxis protein CheE [Phenylobacterium sp. J367]MCR5877638.1 chemotaxis protein CheE [Phenylobacterium sp. J367]